MLMWLAVQLAAANPGDPGKPPPTPQQIEALRQRREGTLIVGMAARDATVYRPDGTATTLLAARKTGRPLVLIFGSFT